MLTPRQSLPHRSSSTESEILGRSRSTSSNRRDKSPVIVSSPGLKIPSVQDIPMIQDRSFVSPTRSPVESDCEVLEGEGDSEAIEDFVFTVNLDEFNVIEDEIIEHDVVVEDVMESAVPKVSQPKKVASSGTLKLRKSSVKTLKADNMNETAQFEGKIIFVDGMFRCNKCAFQCLEIEEIYARKHAKMSNCPRSKNKGGGVLLEKNKQSRKSYRCEECNEVCEGKTRLNQHRKYEHPSKKHKCSKCHREYNSRKCYRQHLNDHLLNFPCTLCQIKFPRLVHLNTHVKKNHPTADSSSTVLNSRTGWKKQVNAALESGDVKK